MHLYVCHIYHVWFRRVAHCPKHRMSWCLPKHWVARVHGCVYIYVCVCRERERGQRPRNKFSHQMLPAFEKVPFLSSFSQILSSPCQKINLFFFLSLSGSIPICGPKWLCRLTGTAILQTVRLWVLVFLFFTPSWFSFLCSGKVNTFYLPFTSYGKYT